MRKAAILKLVKVVQRGLATLPLPEQIEIYEALAMVMPTKIEREQAEHIAWLLKETQKNQLDFTNQLFREFQWPGHQHDGSPDKPKGGRP